MIGLCTDSSALMPPDLIERWGVEVVPLTVTVDGVDHLEGVDLDCDEFYARYRSGRWPDVQTGAPSPGQFAAAYDDLVARGCTEILSVHLTAAIPGTINAARMASRALDIPIRVVDSATAGFGTTCCLWAAAEAIRNGASLDDAVKVAEELRPHVGSTFVVGDPSVLRAPGCTTGLQLPPGTAVLMFQGNEVELVEHYPTAFDAVNAMAQRAIRAGTRSRIGIGHSDADSRPLADAIEAAIGEAASVIELVRYRIGPSVGSHTGPGTVSCITFPADSLPSPSSPTTS
jgi:DegV family protein with EDD domain